MEEAQVVKALAALAQETRLRIFRLLVVAGADGLTPGYMSEALGTPPNAVSFHLKELSQAGMVSSVRDGRNIIYRAEFSLVNDLLVFLTSQCCQGQPCMDAMAVTLRS